jgi:hypothetical protein
MGGSTTKSKLIPEIKLNLPRSFSEKGAVKADAFFKEFVPMLKTKGYLHFETKKLTGQYSRAYELIYISPQGHGVLQSGAEVMLPVLQCVREAEAAAIAKQKARSLHP